MAHGARVDKSGHGFPYEIHRVTVRAADLEDNAAVDTGYDLPDVGIIPSWGVYAKVRTAEATASTKTIDVGLKAGESGGDADGFFDALSVASTGLVKGTLLSSGQTLGALLRVDESGAGVLVPEGHVLNGTAKSVVVTFNDAGGANELDMDIYFVVLQPLD